MSFITAEELKKFPLPVTDKQWALIDGAGAYQIAATIATATQHVQNYLERDIESTTYVERIVGRNRDRLMLNNYPVQSITSVTSTDVYGNETSYGADYFLVNAGSGIIEWVDKFRYTFFPNYIWTVQYTAGYDVIPDTIKHATALQTVNLLQPIFRGGQNFQQVDIVEQLDEQTVDLLERYRRVRIG